MRKSLAVVLFVVAAAASTGCYYPGPARTVVGVRRLPGSDRRSVGLHTYSGAILELRRAALRHYRERKSVHGQTYARV